MGEFKTTFILGLASAALLVACGGGGGGASGKDTKKPAEVTITPPAGGSHALPEMTGAISCLGGTVTINKSMNGAYYVRQAWDADNKTLTQDTVVWANNKGVRQWTVTKQANDKALVINGRYEGGTFLGTGTIVIDATSPDQPWNAWLTEVVMDVGGTKVKGQFAAHKGSFVGNSKVGDKLEFVVDTKGIDEATCKRIFSTFKPL